jgi:hypothetical protein
LPRPGRRRLACGPLKLLADARHAVDGGQVASQSVLVAGALRTRLSRAHVVADLEICRRDGT